METVIWKYPIHGTDVIITMPEAARVVHVAWQGEIPTIWAVVHPDRDTTSRHFRLAMTGELIVGPHDHLGTLLTDNDMFVIHILEVVA